jgi:hypothetical protein
MKIVSIEKRREIIATLPRFNDGTTRPGESILSNIPEAIPDE